MVVGIILVWFGYYCQNLHAYYARFHAQDSSSMWGQNQPLVSPKQVSKICVFHLEWWISGRCSRCLFKAGIAENRWKLYDQDKARVNRAAFEPIGRTILCRALNRQHCPLLSAWPSIGRTEGPVSPLCLPQTTVACRILWRRKKLWPARPIVAIEAPYKHYIL